MIITLPNENTLHGVKIFDGIDEKTNLPYCMPTISSKTKYVYNIGENTYDGDIELCKSGFHFCMNLLDAYNYKMLIGVFADKKYPKAAKMKPVYKVYAKGKVLADIGYSHSGYIQKFVTNNLVVGKPILYNQIMNYILAYNLCGIAKLDKQEVSTSTIPDLHQYIHQGEAKIITVDKLTWNNFTIFSDVIHLLTVVNKTKYTQYVTRYDCYEQYITPVPRYSTVEFDQLDKIGKVIKNVKE